MKTKGALLWELNSPFKVDEIDLGDPVADEVQIRMHAAGMCHSDYHITTGATPIGLPALGGHEGAGVVTKVGKNVTGIEEGDHVILAFIPACGTCPPCLKGFRSLCDRGAVLLGGKAIADGTSRIHAGDREVSPMNLLGTFAPYMTVHKDSVVKIDKDIPFETAAIMGCAVPTGFGSATNVAEVKPGETVIIVGVGGSATTDGDPSATAQALIAARAAGIRGKELRPALRALKRAAGTYAVSGGVTDAGATGTLLLTAAATGGDPRSFGGTDLVSLLRASRR
mgnify:CR=1 FL=1